MFKVAYFSMEFALHEEFPSYSGGLGVLAGDFLKGAQTSMMRDPESLRLMRATHVKEPT